MFGKIFVVLAFSIISCCTASSLDPRAEQLHNEKHCILLTPAKHKQIQILVKRIDKFINELTEEFEDFDFRTVKISIENHLDSEDEEKETILQININDCAQFGIKEEDKIPEEKRKHEHTQDKDEERENENVNGNEDVNTKPPNKVSNDVVQPKIMDEFVETASLSSINEFNENVAHNESGSPDTEHDGKRPKKNKVKPNLVFLKLSDTANEVLSMVKNRTRPLLVILEDEGRIIVP